MRRRFPLVVAGWLVTGALATGAGVAVVGFLGEPLTASAHRPLSPAEVRQALARAAPPGTASGSTPGTTASPRDAVGSPAPSASGALAGRSKVITTAGGSVIARCDGGLVVLRAWSPAQGFRVDDAERGPAARVRVEFESDETDVEVEVRCSAEGLPVHRIHD
ncbi:hypothetical protein ACFOWE_14050 [Planomonospora corallina]|uniref:Septum formation initiator n=1 Tax=Planomonospora corallina TaxID=1806052 RepID=A0ABV8I8S6_9ACTN